MSAPEHPSADAAAPTPAAEAPRFRRLPERWIAGIGLGIAAVLQGGFTLAVTRSDDAAVRDVLLPALGASGIELSDADATAMLETLAAWFGLSLIVMALLCAVGFFIAARRPVRRSTGWWFLAAGLVCLFGTQLLLYPVAFLFFLAAGLFAVRSPQQRSTT